MGGGSDGGAADVSYLPGGLQPLLMKMSVTGVPESESFSSQLCQVLTNGSEMVKVKS